MKRSRSSTTILSDSYHIASKVVGNTLDFVLWPLSGIYALLTAIGDLNNRLYIHDSRDLRSRDMSNSYYKGRNTPKDFFNIIPSIFTMILIVPRSVVGALISETNLLAHRIIKPIFAGLITGVISLLVGIYYALSTLANGAVGLVNSIKNWRKGPATTASSLNNSKSSTDYLAGQGLTYASEDEDIEDISYTWALNSNSTPSRPPYTGAVYLSTGSSISSSSSSSSADSSPSNSLR